MKHNIFLLALALIVSVTVSAQEKFTLENTIPGGKDYFPHRLSAYCGAFDPATGEFVSKEELDKKKVRDTIAEAYSDYDYAPDRSHVAVSDQGDLFIADSNGTIIKVNGRKGRGIVYGTSVHRNEFGIEKGIFWSPSGSKLAFYRMDESMVAEYPKVDITKRIAQEDPFRYPMAGETSHEVSVGVYDLSTKNTVYLKTASPVNRYFTNIAWSADSKYILVAEINREQNHLWMNVYNAADGSFVKTLFEEQSNEWVEPCTPPYFIDNKQFVWISERDGFKHLYLYNIDNAKCTQLTKGNFCVTEIYGAANGVVYFQANQKGYLYRDICKVDLKGRFTCLSKGEGVHSANFNKNFTQYIDIFSSPDVALTCTLCKSDGTTVKVLKQTVNPYDNFKMPEVRIVNLKTADGKFPLSGRIILPPDFDSTKTYPVIDYVYGGPHSQLVTGSWLYGASPWMLYFAQQGYIVFNMDNRGTEFRGRDYEHCIHRRLGELEMQDQMEGVKYLKSLKYVDSNRIGVHGWSYGGFMTIDLLTTYPGVFKAGVAGGPVCHWQYYEVMYGERYMDTPEENPDGYERTAVINNIGNLKDRLLVIHGDIDNVVVWQHSLSLLRKAVDTGVQIDYAVYPQHEHNVLGHDRVHLYQKIERYFEDFLK